jgi:hypothetical protein
MTTSSPYSWLSTNQYKSYNWKVINPTLDWVKDEWNKNAEYESTLINMVCNNTYIYLLLEYAEECYILYSKNTSNGKENIVYVRGKSVNLYCNQSSHTDECVVITDTDIYLYKNGKMFTHDYLYTIINVYLTFDKLIVRDEFKMQYVYTYSQENPTVELTSSNLENGHTYTFYGSTRIDIKSDFCRLTHIDEIPQYYLIPDIYPSNYAQLCISNNICAIQTGDTSITYLVNNG